MLLLAWHLFLRSLLVKLKKSQNESLHSFCGVVLLIEALQMALGALGCPRQKAICDLKLEKLVGS